MSKRKRSVKRRNMVRRRQILKIAVAVFLLVSAVMMLPMCQRDAADKGAESVVGVWISYGDFSKLGLYNQSEEHFRENAEAFLDTAETYGVNTVYFHVRAFRDAVYNSEYFPLASFVWDRSKEIDYDPLQIMTELAHKHNMKLHAWMNPYRNISFEKEILDPASKETQDEILLAVREVLDNYDVDGIHFDDYFYEEGNTLPETEKKKNVNRMVKAVYKEVHKTGHDLVFGISPAGNTAYCESIGADIETWLSEDGYVDYIVPQIYWTDEHTAPWRDNMFTNTLDEWIALNKADAELYIGLAAYKAGLEEDADPGWKNSDRNLASQVEMLTEKGCDGYVFFSAGDFYRNSACDELGNYRNLVF